MWFKREQKNKNRRLHRHHVLDVKLRSDQVRAGRVRMLLLALLVPAVTVLVVYLFWCVGAWTLDTFVYQNADFAIQQIEVKTDGVIAPEQLRRWSRVKLGANLIALDLAEVKRNLELMPVIESVSVERVLPRTLKIRVTEREPVAQVNVPRMDGGAITVSVFQLDADGVVMVPLDPRLCVVPLAQMNAQLPVIAGLNAFQLQPGRRVELPPVQAALRLITAFDQSPMAGLVDLRRVDVAQPGVLVAVTGQGTEITFGLDNLELQLRRWREIYDYGKRMNKGDIASADLAVANNVPVHWTTASATPVVTPKTVKPVKNRRKNV